MKWILYVSSLINLVQRYGKIETGYNTGIYSYMQPTPKLMIRIFCISSSMVLQYWRSLPLSVPHDKPYDPMYHMPSMDLVDRSKCNQAKNALIAPFVSLRVESVTNQSCNINHPSYLESAYSAREEVKCC